MSQLHRTGALLGLALLATSLAAGCGTGTTRIDAADDEVVEIELPDEILDDSSSSATVPRNGIRTDETGSLRPGERFPLTSRFEEELEQQTPQGVLISRSVLELHFCVVYEGGSPEGGGTPPFEVRFDQVRFSREIPGQPRSEFDSSVPGTTAPADLKGIAGLAGNGFRYRFSPRLGIQGSVDFGKFLERCAAIANDPPEPVVHAPDGLKSSQTRWGSRAAAETLRDLLGIVWLRKTRIGDRWSESRLFLRPLPWRLESDYVLLQQRGDDAGIEWQSQAIPLNPSGETQEDQLALELIAGEGSGSAWIDRRSGLPRVLEQTQRLEMWVQTADGQGFRQVMTSLLKIARDTQETTPRGVIIQAGFDETDLEQDRSKSRAARTVDKPAALPISKPARQGPKSPAGSQRRS